ncbi:uncharacterized protein LY89DRAFT_140532 [Mollisia scopiformis]|uniref:2EXR domain-containing protein n=1 Tax=Mollisia scopiformis TaxID=149040 RepID=A0A194X2R4_MOLSC|nr:uncharacterized protein LY89DRAFT_140532 [Mollisia scopiformis]KUJ14475.1 hypothetical protein LY89DRAFT_140532 [Mollisia scopiformis]
MIDAQSHEAAACLHPPKFTMGQSPSTTRQRGDFEKFLHLDYDVRFMIWRLSLPGPRIVEVQHSHNVEDPSWISTCHPPPTLQVCRESRMIALKFYTFCHSDRMRVYLNPSIDTLYFGPFANQHAFAEFVEHADPDDLLSLKKLAINEMYLPTWRSGPPWTTFPSIGDSPSKILTGLTRLLIGVEIESEGYPNTAKLHAVTWEGWLFGGGPWTNEEMETLNGNDDPNLIMSAHSWDGHLFHIDTRGFVAAYSGSMAFQTAIEGHFRHKLLKFYYPPDPDRLGLRKQNRPHLTSRILPPDSYVWSWYRRVYRAVARADARVKRIFEMQKRENPLNLDIWDPPRVASFVRPAGSFLSWKQCLEPVFDAWWSSYQDLTRFAIAGKGKGNCIDEHGDIDSTVNTEHRA